jgi:predicted permease
MRQLLTEGLLLAILGGSLGLAMAASLNEVVIAKIATRLPRADQIHLDGSVLGFNALVALLASVLFGITPALEAARSDVSTALKEGGRGTTSRHGLQRALVVVEVALALVLATSAGLMMRTMSQLWSVNPGFDPQSVLTFGVAGSPAVHGTPTAVRNGVTQTTERLRSLPGVQAISLVGGAMPMKSDSELPYWVEGRPKPDQSQMDLALFSFVDPGYLSVMHIPLSRGRFLSPQDDENSPCVAVIDQEFVRRAFPNQDPLGQRVNLELLQLRCEVVGVVGHVKQWGLDADATAKVQSQMYLASRQIPDSVMDLISTGSEYVVRTTVAPYALVPALKRSIAGINGKMVAYGEESMVDVIGNSLSARRFTRLLLGVFAALALALAAVGIYGVVSYSVAQSTHEIGVRMALGADRSTVLKTVLSGALQMALIGIAIGAVSALAVTRVMKDLLFGVSAADPATFGATALLLASVTVVASYVPARRATKVDPIVALRYE